MWHRSVKSALNLKSEDHRVNGDGGIWARGRNKNKIFAFHTAHCFWPKVRTGWNDFSFALPNWE